jgi:sphingolipid 4-desaturase/C4-monooxygenase
MGNSQKEFTWSKEEEPHAIRRKKILSHHPEIKDLMGPDIRLLPCVLLLVGSQFGMAYLSQDCAWPLYLLSAWMIGGTISHSLSLSVHELSHGLCFENESENEALAIFANCAQGIPSAITFKRYHMEHHQKQGHDGIDVDIPTIVEGNLIGSTMGKICFIFLQPILYALRPIVVYPKPLLWKEIVNWVIVLVSNYIVYYYSPSCLWYLLLSDGLGHGMHPISGHFISEHYEFVSNQETSSYYGPLNLITFNVGYHNEHHDFTRVSGFHLPKIREIAKEYYDSLSYHESWSLVLWNFVFDPTVSPFSRIKRYRKN